MCIYIYVYAWSWMKCRLFVRESDARCAVLRKKLVPKILPDRKGKWADESLKGHSPFRSEACEKIALCHGAMCRRTFAKAAFLGGTAVLKTGSLHCEDSRA